MLCELCGRETDQRFYYPTKVARVTHQLKDGLWLCLLCNNIKWYRDQEFSFFPLKPRSKKPNIKKWKPYQEKKPSWNEIKSWLKNKLFGGVAVVCGSVSNNLVVLDFDDKTVYRKVFTKHEELKKTTFVIETSRGYHVYLRSSTPPGRTEKYENFKFEYRADGGYVCAPPSIHPSGVEYVNVGSRNILEVADAQEEKERILKKLGASPQQRKPKIMNCEAALTHDYPCWNKLSRGVFEGARDDAAFLLAIHLRDKKLSKNVVLAVMKEWWKKLPQPPVAKGEFTVEELEEKVDQAFKTRNHVGCTTIRKRWPGLCSPNCPLLLNRRVIERRKYGYSVVFQ